MTKEELAAKLNGREYREEITPAEEAEAKAAGLVVLFGASDDLAEFRGALNDELGCYDGGEALIVDGELFDFDACDSQCKYAQAAADAAREHGIAIEIVSGAYWTYRTETPHATFDVLEDGETYCRGIVFYLPGA